jgi:hypothetical protein
MAQNKRRAGINPKKNRAPIPPEVRDEVLRKCRRRCCMCFGLRDITDAVDGQIAHLDQDNANPQPNNLAYLCLQCHKIYDQWSNRAAAYSPREIRRYREALYRAISQDKRELQIIVEVTEEEYETAQREFMAAYNILQKKVPGVAM